MATDRIFINEITTARKEHTCSFCGKIIEKDKRYAYVKGVRKSKFYLLHMHEKCVELKRKENELREQHQKNSGKTRA